MPERFSKLQECWAHPNCKRYIASELAWQAVAIVYQEALNKEKLRELDDIKRHWVKNLCNGMKKPTGSRGGGGGMITTKHAKPTKD